jgi:fermentation-respiration switch protein FrsA (DUF1100 family)
MLVYHVNPITYVGRNDPPFLIVHGGKDPIVPINQSQLLFEALKKSQVSAHFHTIHGAGHGGPGFASQNINDMVSTFFDERLKSTSVKIEALSSESTADPATTERDQRKGVPRPARRRGGIPWQAITARDDKNKDGKVAKDEFSGPPQLFQTLDRNKDGLLTREEHEVFQSRQQR